MITLQELCHYLNTLLQPNLISDYCINGLQIEGKKEISKIATGVSANLATIQAAIEWGADVLIVHHGIFWNQDSPLITGVKKEKIWLLLQNKVSLLSYHLPLDVHQKVGNNWKAAHDMEWTDLQPFCLVNGTYFGVKGKFKKMSRENFQKMLESYYEHSASTALGGKEEIESAGLLSGGGYKFITHAINDKLDCFVTGTFDEPIWSQAFEEKINFYALGHSATEKIGPRALGEHLNKIFKLENAFLDIFNPF